MIVRIMSFPSEKTHTSKLIRFKLGMRCDWTTLLKFISTQKYQQSLNVRIYVKPTVYLSVDYGVMVLQPRLNPALSVS
jgi:hypothetical protein